jgi:hypothetical protein
MVDAHGPRDKYSPIEQVFSNDWSQRYCILLGCLATRVPTLTRTCNILERDVSRLIRVSIRTGGES